MKKSEIWREYGSALAILLTARESARFVPIASPARITYPQNRAAPAPNSPFFGAI
jgi:hypothetical protein